MLLELHRQTLEAEQVLKDRGSSLSPEGLMAVMLRAGATQDQAETAYCDAVLAQEK